MAQTPESKATNIASVLMNNEAITEETLISQSITGKVTDIVIRVKEEKEENLEMIKAVLEKNLGGDYESFSCAGVELKGKVIIIKRDSVYDQKVFDLVVKMMNDNWKMMSKMREKPM